MDSVKRGQIRVQTGADPDDLWLDKLPIDNPRERIVDLGRGRCFLVLRKCLIAHPGDTCWWILTDHGVLCWGEEQDLLKGSAHVYSHAHRMI